MASRREPYAGNKRRLVVSIDVGTTFTAASFAILQPEQDVKFEEVLRWPMQANPDAKVPSVLMYDQAGKPQAFGAECEDEEVQMNQELEGWSRTEWWKLHLRPAHLPLINGLTLPALPPGKTVDNVFADFLGYIRKQLEAYITNQYGAGADIWTALYPTMYVILTTPNGWEGGQQQRMRNAAIRAGLVDKDGGRRVRFVTEAEAAVLYAVDSGCISDWLVEDGQLILCDCGGGTVDTTGYKIIGLRPLRLEESAASRCYLAGAIFVTNACRDYLNTVLRGSEWGKPDAINHAVQHFERNGKRKFEDPEKPCWVEVGGFKNSPTLGIIKGRLKVPGETVASFYKSSLDKIKESLEIAFDNGGQIADKVILVGGLASSPYVYAQLQEWGVQNGISVSRPDGPTTKAVANGALAWHLDTSVSARVNRYHYGIEAHIPYNPQDREHVGRKPWADKDGSSRVSYHWSSILPKGAKVDASQEFTRTFYWNADEGLKDYIHTVSILVYRRTQPPAFTRFPGKNTFVPGFETLCTVSGDLRANFLDTKRKIATDGKHYRTVEFDVVLSLGETELTARIRWKSKDEWKYSDASLAYE